MRSNRVSVDSKERYGDKDAVSPKAKHRIAKLECRLMLGTVALEEVDI